MTQNTSFDDGEPCQDLEAILVAVGYSLVIKGRLEDTSIFSKANISLEYVTHDNWDGGTPV